ncbi:MAG: carbohydrate-binding domain-containing protein, partial [Fibrobacter sp.]|nr:carbohydrate-binding domain-containing protein [Fibrobacter sp.]
MVRWLMVIMVMMVGSGAVWAQDVALSGKIVDSETSKGVANATISLKNSPDISALSSGDGSFSIQSSQTRYAPKADLTRSLALKNNRLVFSSGLLAENTKAEIFSANGTKKATLKLNTSSKTQNSIALPQLSSGLNFIHIRSGNVSYFGTLYSLGQKMFLTNVKISGNSFGTVAKKEAAISAVADTLVVSKSGYGTKEYALKSLSQSDITIELTPVSINGTKISLLTNSIEVDGTGATVNGTEVVVVSSGTYIISGKLTDGKIVVRTEDKEDVVLIMNNVEISNSATSPLFVENAKNVIIELADGSENSFTDAAQYSEFFEDDEPNATVFSKDDLTIRGGGKLTIKSNYNDAIVCKDGLTITDGNFVINSVDDGIRGKDFLLITGGSFNITSGGDGLSSNDSGDVSTGYISIQNGYFDITSAKDGIQAQNYVEISGGEFNIISGGGSSASAKDDLSAKGIKATNSIKILGGTFTINSADDAIHSNALVDIKDGSFTIASGDDGIHADDTLIIAKANINITKSYEGLESLVMIINSGTVRIVSSDDGINIAGGTDGSGMGGGWGGGWGGGGGFAATDGAH